VKKYYQQIGGQDHGEILYETQDTIAGWVSGIIHAEYDGDLWEYENDNDAISFLEITAPVDYKIVAVTGPHGYIVFAPHLFEANKPVLRFGEGIWLRIGATADDLGLATD